jgi:very-short-patch-repair endonuclease
VKTRKRINSSNRRKGIQFYRQKPIGKCIVDFYAPKAKPVIEIDGSQHMDITHAEKDKYRDSYLTAVGLSVLRFNSREVLNETEAVVEVIYRWIAKHLGNEIPPAPLLNKGGNNIFPLCKGGSRGI